MKSNTVVALVFLALCGSGTPRHFETKSADKNFLIKQRFLLDIFQHIYQDDIFVTKFDDSYGSYIPWEHPDNYEHPDKVRKFSEVWQKAPFLDDQIFSPFEARSFQYIHGIGNILYYAKNWETFSYSVYWARMNINKQLFVYMMYVVCMGREDLRGIELPAVYEIHPWHFFDVETIEAAERYRMHGFHNVKMLDNMYNVVIKSNYSNVYGNVNYDHNLAYYMEDIGLNAFYFYYNIDYLFFTRGPVGREYSRDNRGELYLYIHQQLLARYYLERLSNDLGEIPHFNMYQPYDAGYFSDLRYYKGVRFPDRDNHYNFYHSKNFDLVKDIHFYENRIAEYVDTTHDDYRTAVEKLGNILQGNMDSVDIEKYGKLDTLYRKVVNAGRPYGRYGETLPGTLMHYETSLRDPVFYSIYKEIMSYYWRLMKKYPEYKQSDLEFPGVKIEDVHVPDGLTTYFEYFDADISNAVNVESPAQHESQDALYTFGRNSVHDGHSYVIKARQLRLNHKPFEFTLDVTSDKAQKAVVKVFLGPKYDENGHKLHLESNYMNFFELDHYWVELAPGVNHLKRSSDEFGVWVHDRTTYLDLYRKVMDATNGDYEFQLSQGESHCGVPQRMMLPKGKEGGMVYQMFFMVFPYHAPTLEQHSTYDPVISCGIGSGSRYVDSLPFGFPFNRPVGHEYYYHVDNFKFHDINIYRKVDATNIV